MPIRPAERDDAVTDALLRGAAESAAALCLCDADDRIRYANPRFRRAFFPQFDEVPTDFMDAIVAALRAGEGLKLESSGPDDFARRSRGERLDLVGSRSFSADMADGSWWSVTDTKLSNGWMLIVAQEITGLKDEEARLRDAHHSALMEANTDYLTGVSNRRHGLRQAESLWRAARAGGHDLAAALLDVDHFKAINDVYGHEAGDRALRHLAAAVMAAIEIDDRFSRIGGDEFLLLRPRVGARTLEAALAGLVARLPAVDLVGGAEPLRLSISVGVAEARAGESWPELMHRADMALYDAKAGGRNRIARAG